MNWLVKMKTKLNWIKHSFEHTEYYDAIIMENPQLTARVFIRSLGKDENLIAVYNNDEVDMTYMFTFITIDKFENLELYLLYAEEKIIGFLGDFFEKIN